MEIAAATMNNNKARVYGASLLVIMALDMAILPPHNDQTGRGNTVLALQSVVVIMRHGDRAPLQQLNWQLGAEDKCPRNLWPAGYGMLTAQGKARVYRIGNELYTRYVDQLTDRKTFTMRDLYVQSSSVARTIESAMVLAAALIKLVQPPWSKSTPLGQIWQPVPVYMIRDNRDGMLNTDAECSQYKLGMNRLFESVMAKTNLTESQLRLLASMSDDVLCRRLHGFDLPKELTSQDGNFYTFSYETIFQALFGSVQPQKFTRLKVGLLVHELMVHLRLIDSTNIFQQQGTDGKPKMSIFLTHDTKLTQLLTVLGLDSTNVIRRPGFTLVLESYLAHRLSSDTTAPDAAHPQRLVKIFTHHTDHPRNKVRFERVDLSFCTSTAEACTGEELMNKLKPFAVATLEQYKRECSPQSGPVEVQVKQFNLPNINMKAHMTCQLINNCTQP